MLSGNKSMLDRVQEVVALHASQILCGTLKYSDDPYDLITGVFARSSWVQYGDALKIPKEYLIRLYDFEDSDGCFYRITGKLVNGTPYDASLQSIDKSRSWSDNWEDEITSCFFSPEILVFAKLALDIQESL